MLLSAFIIFFIFIQVMTFDFGGGETKMSRHAIALIISMQSWFYFKLIFKFKQFGLFLNVPLWSNVP